MNTTATRIYNFKTTDIPCKGQTPDKPKTRFTRTFGQSNSVWQNTYIKGLYNQFTKGTYVAPQQHRYK